VRIHRRSPHSPNMTNTKQSLQGYLPTTISFLAILIAGCTLDSTELGHLFSPDGGGQQNLDVGANKDLSPLGTGGAGEGGNGGSNTGGAHSGGNAGGGNSGSSGGSGGGGNGGENSGGGTGGAGAGGGTGTICGTIAGLSCSNGTYCELPPASCNVADAAGTCTVKPQVCSAIAAPVCGCNGKTYTNDCARQNAGVSKATDGTCPTGAGGDGGNNGTGGNSGGGGGGGGGGGSGTFCGGLLGASCSNGTYCEFPSSSCGNNSASGVCTVKPDVCSTIATPVCGCDGKIYSNDCIRQNAGVSKLADGTCPAGMGGNGGQ
jgi:hypothetical protein